MRSNTECLLIWAFKPRPVRTACSTTYSFKIAQKYYSAIFCLVYLQLLWSSLVGFYFFNEYLNKYALIGAGLIVLSGIISVPGQIKQANDK